MNSVLVLIKRNLRLFVRDRATVFFSFLSTIILVTLYFLFIAKMYTAGMDDPGAGGIAMPLAEGAKNFIVYLQMMAGVLVLNSMSLATGAFSTIAKDFENKRIDNLLLTPVKPHEMIVAYFSAGFVASFCFNTFTWLVSFAIIGLSTGYWLAGGVFLTVLLVLFVASLVSCSIMLVAVTLLKSSSAIGVVNGVAGTFFGFLCGIYMPYSNMGATTRTVGSLLPFTHITIWLKQVVLGDAFRQVGIPGDLQEVLLSNHFSAESIGIVGIAAPLWAMMLFSGLFAALCLVASYRLLSKRIGR